MNKAELAALLREKADSLEKADSAPAPEALTRDDVLAIVKEAMAENAKPSESKPEPSDRERVEAALKDILPAVGAPQKGNGLDREAVAKMTPEQINSNWEAVSAAISE